MYLIEILLKPNFKVLWFQFKLWILEVLLVVRMVNFYSCEDPTFSSSIQSHDDILYINKEILKHVTFD